MIALKHISKQFGAISAIKDVSLELPRESVTVIHGPSGSGKTTLLRLIAGLEHPSAGEIHIAGELASTPEWVLAPHKRGVGFVFQQPALWPHLTVAQNVAFGLMGYPRREVAQRVDTVLATMELAGLQKRYPNQLSGGQARRVAIARTLVVDPDILLLDEPLTHLQPDLKLRLLEAIRDQVNNKSITLVYVTHNLDEAEQLGEPTISMVDGRLVRKDE